MVCSAWLLVVGGQVQSSRLLVQEEGCCTMESWDPWDPPSLLLDGYRVFPGGKERPERAADHSLPSSVVVMEE